MSTPTAEDRDLAFALGTAAVRYALGRRTYGVEIVARTVRRSLAVFPGHDLRRLAREIDEAIDGGDVGDPCDEVVWCNLAADVRAELARRAKEGT